MTGLLHIVLARKPIEGTVAENCLQWGCGALWIDGCRVGIDDGSRTRPPSKPTMTTFAQDKWTQNPSNRKPFDPLGQGRWPANLILGHCENCRRQGTKKVKGNAPVASGYDRLNKKQAELGYRPGEYQKGEVEPGYCHTDVDGKEMVEVWDCEKNCVTMGFPLTGLSTGGKTGAVGSEGRYNGGWNGTNPGISAGGFAGSGSASRFFFNFSEQESDE